MTVTLGPLADLATTASRSAVGVVESMWRRDHTVWQDEPAPVADRLGWLDAPRRAETLLPRLTALADEVAAEGITDVLLVGTGGSTQYPRVLTRVLGSAPGMPRLELLDSTDPAAVLDAERRLPWSRTLFVSASESGTTIETLSHLDRFTVRLEAAHGREGACRRIVAITDPGSPLDERATAEGFRAVVHGDEDVGAASRR